MFIYMDEITMIETTNTTRNELGEELLEAFAPGDVSGEVLLEMLKSF